jgi:hypothetical protein
VEHTPGVSKVDHEDPHKHNSGPSGTLVLQPFILEPTNDTRNDEVTNGHTRGTGDENLLATDLIHPEHGRDGEHELDNADDTGSEEGSGISRELHILEDVWAG